MNLLLVIPYFAPAYAFGGSVTVAETVVHDLLEAGHQVTVATTDVLDEHRRLAPGAPAVPTGARVLRFPNASHALAARLNGYNPRGLRAWLSANAGRFDVVLLQDVYSVLSVAGARAALAAGIPYVLQPLGTLSTAPERGRPLVKRAFLALWGRETVRAATALFPCAAHEAEDLREAGAREEQLVAMPLPLELPVHDEQARAGRPTISFVGRLHLIKGLEPLIEAVALARLEVPEVRLEVVGPGDSYRRRLEELARRLGIQDAVRFHGFVDAEEKLRILRSSHVSVLLSRSEGLPMAALEAMACGTPVLLSRGCHLDEVDGVAGVVVPGQAQEAARALVGLLRDPGLL
ncbi:MAG TPA: glycosyltransferase, partial [Myxococcaceae bacterium]|nr:glycosyltransferase [Myxococcaceae bacterium]